MPAPVFCPEPFAGRVKRPSAEAQHGEGQEQPYAGGSGYYANGGKIIPITWSCDGDSEPFRFFHEDGTPLDIGVGNTYIAVAPTGSPVTWSAAEAPAETTAETTAE